MQKKGGGESFNELLTTLEKIHKNTLFNHSVKLLFKKSLIIVEVEFSSIEEANSFVPPDWFGEDVTNSILYHNSYLSTHPIN